ncbi:biotin--[acetyl-CoA-carboxylase] ligase [Ascidiimonas aurantiaca]|uniref:biotin--[acetyl-CoA-carboxylase] ligase n=1 Tax=Ascidiimonas aurantiaca TaxID=1685432 RepID=UPI0030EC2A7B
MIIKLDAIDSTNTFLKGLSSQKELPDYTIVTTREQTHGRGQMGTTWSAEPGQNLTFSVFKQLQGVNKASQFYLNMAVSIAILKALEYFVIPSVKIKWPNDILSGNQKICGILIETVLRQHIMNAAVIGVGLNVNQNQFDERFNATSMKLLTGRSYFPDEVMEVIIDKLKHYENYLTKSGQKQLKKEYESYLFRKDKPSTFIDMATNVHFMGFITGVSPNGKLRVLLEDEILKEYALKEVKLLY